MSNKKKPQSEIKQKLSMLLWLVSFVFIILLVSIAVAGLFWHLMMTMGVLAPLTMERPLHAFMFMLLVSLVVGTVLAAIGGDYLLRPLRRLTEGTKEIANGNFNVRVEEKGPQELVSLAASFNNMAKELSGIETLRSDFVSNISHEYKTPIAAIHGFAKRLMKSNLTGDEQREYISIIVSESERLSRLSSNVLLLSNLETTSRDTEQAEYPLDEQLRKVILLLEPQLDKKQLDVEIDLEKVSIIAGEEILHHLWINLLGNAIKFSHVGGVVKVTLNVVNNKAVVSISDNGIGMGDEVKTRIFEKFYQGDCSRTTEGNGLGLALVKRILELENGNIAVESEPGKGTCFTVVLRIQQSAKAPIPSQFSPKPPYSAYTAKTP